MSDPAVEAAQRAVDTCKYSPEHMRYEMEAAAREMAEPIRELIAKARTWKPYVTRDIGSAYCADTVDDFLDELSKRVYPSEELGL